MLRLMRNWKNIALHFSMHINKSQWAIFITLTTGWRWCSICRLRRRFNLPSDWRKLQFTTYYVCSEKCKIVTIICQDVPSMRATHFCAFASKYCYIKFLDVLDDFFLLHASNKNVKSSYILINVIFDTPMSFLFLLCRVIDEFFLINCNLLGIF